MKDLAVKREIGLNYVTMVMTRWWVGSNLCHWWLGKSLIWFVPISKSILAYFWSTGLWGGLLFFLTLWTVARQAPLSMGLARQEYWRVLPFPSPGNLPNSGTETDSPVWQAGFLALSNLGSPWDCALGFKNSSWEHDVAPLYSVSISIRFYSSISERVHWFIFFKCAFKENYFQMFFLLCHLIFSIKSIT